jgi:hypothetical protein
VARLARLVAAFGTDQADLTNPVRRAAAKVGRVKPGHVAGGRDPYPCVVERVAELHSGERAVRSPGWREVMQQRGQVGQPHAAGAEHGVQVVEQVARFDRRNRQRGRGRRPGAMVAIARAITSAAASNPVSSSTSTKNRFSRSNWTSLTPVMMLVPRSRPGRSSVRAGTATVRSPSCATLVPR